LEWSRAGRREGGIRPWTAIDGGVGSEKRFAEWGAAAAGVFEYDGGLKRRMSAGADGD